MGKVKDWDVSLTKNTDPYTFSVRNNYSFIFTVTRAPTNNCQVSSIGAMNYILSYTKSKSEKTYKEDTLAIIKEAYSLIKQELLQIIIDVQDKWIKTVEECFVVMCKQPYTSTNGSKMCLFLVKIPKG